MNTLDVVFIFIFVFVNIAVALKVRGSSKSFGEYAIGEGRKFNSWAIIITMVATYVSGSLLITGVQQTYVQGLPFIVMNCIVYPISYVLFAIFVVPKLTMRSLSVYEYIGSIYGDKVRFILAMSEILFKIGYNALQLRIIGIAVNMVFGFDLQVQNIVIICFTFLLAIYTAFGGVRSVSITDVVQGVFFFCIICTLAFYMWGQTDDHSGFVNLFSNENPKMNVNNFFSSFPVAVSVLAMWFRALIPWHSTPEYQRVLICGDTSKARRAMGMATLIYTSVSIMIIFIGLQVAGLKPGMQLDEIFPYIMDTFSFPGMKGLLFICMISLIISTVDSHLNAVAVILTNDILPILGKRYSLFQEKTYATAVKSTIITISISLFFALKSSDVFKILMMSANFDVPVAMTILFTVLGFRTQKNCVGVGLASAIITTITYMVVMRNSGYAQYAFFPGMIANMIGLFGSHIFWKIFGKDISTYLSYKKYNDSSKEYGDNFMRLKILKDRLKEIEDTHKNFRKDLRKKWKEDIDEEKKKLKVTMYEHILENNELIVRHKITKKVIDVTHNSDKEIYDAYSEWFYFKKFLEDSLEENEIEENKKYNDEVKTLNEEIKKLEEETLTQ